MYAASRYWPPDFGLILVYDFPVPSPHLVNLGKSIETLLLTDIKVVITKLKRGREREETVKILRALNASEIVAGDVYVEDHLKYMESIANEVGAKLKEPLWGLDPEDLVYKIYSWGIRSLITGIKGCMKEWLGKEVSKDSIDRFVYQAKSCNYDPLGERGEYHTLVIESPLHTSPLKYKILEVIKTKDFDGKDYYILKVV